MSEIEKILARIKSGKSSARAEVEAAIKRAEDASEYNAILEIIRQRSLARADEIDMKLAAGEEVGKLAGVPFVAKDNFLTLGSKTTAASKMLENFKSPIQATAIEKLEAEGAICIGKANLDSFAHGGSTENSAFGVTKNASDLARVAGGSSGGSAVAVALDIVPFALGSDTGGSIRQPASFNGVVGYKPTYGMISRYGVVAMASSTDVVGPITKSACDAELICEILAGRDGRDGTVLADYFGAGIVASKTNPNNLREINREIVGGFVMSNDEKVLLGQNRKGGVYDDLLVVPGGGIENNETEIQALAREIKEEVGVDISEAKVKKIDLIMNRSTEKTLRDSGERVWVNMTFHTYIMKFDKPADEIKTSFDDDFAWAEFFTRDELLAKKFSPSTEACLRDIGYLPAKRFASKPKPRIGLVREFMNENVDTEVLASTKNFVEKLQKNGYEVDEVDLPMAHYSLPIYYIVVPAELSSNLARYDGIRYGLRASDAKTLSEIYAKSRDEGFVDENKRRIMIGSFVLSSGFFDAYYLQAQKARTLLINEFNKLFERYDLLVGPTAPTPAFKIGENAHDPIKMYMSDVMTVPASLAGLPAISIPAGKSKDGLPIGVQIIGPMRADADVLALAKVMEANNG